MVVENIFAGIVEGVIVQSEFVAERPGIAVVGEVALVLELVS